MNTKAIVLVGAAVLAVAASRLITIEIVRAEPEKSTRKRSRGRFSDPSEYVINNSYSHSTDHSSFGGGSFDGAGATTSW